MDAHSETLKCRWIALRVIADDALELQMPAGNCCDMRGLLRAATALMPDVTEIRTTSAGAADTLYTRHDGEWLAYIPSAAQL